MDPADLSAGFQLGDWLIEPRNLRIACNGVSRSVELHLMRLLVCLACRHGEVVDRQTLRECVGKNRNITDDMLRAAIHQLRDLLGDSTREPRYIVAVPHGGYALIAHFVPPAKEGARRPAIEGEERIAGVSFVARIQRFAYELQRRHVLKVVGAYMLGIWITLQVAETTFEPLHFPDWWMTALTILAVIGVPVIASLAWYYEITPLGIALDPLDAGRVQLPRARRAVAPLLVIGVAFMAGVTGLAWWRSIDLRQAANLASAPPHYSIAVLPFADLTPGEDQTYVGDGLTDEISAHLARIPGLRVVPPVSTFKFKARGFDTRKIGEALGVQLVLQGSVRRQDGRLWVTTQLVQASNGNRLWAESYDRDWRDVAEVQREISLSVANALGVVPSTVDNP